MVQEGLSLCRNSGLNLVDYCNQLDNYSWALIYGLDIMPHNLKYYRSLNKVRKKFNHGKHAKFVGLMEGNVVKKKYSHERFDVFKTEVEVMKRLKGCSFVPKLLMVDHQKLTIYLEYCGKTLTAQEMLKYQTRIRKYQQILSEKYQVFHNDIKVGNVCLNSKGQLYLIDFGWAREYQGLAGYGLGKIGDLENQSDKVKLKTRQELCDLLFRAEEKLVNDSQLALEIRNALELEGYQFTNPFRLMDNNFCLLEDYF